MSIENPQAFPVSTIDGFTHEGMTLRDWFAGRALPEAFTYAVNHPESLMAGDYLPEEWAAKIAYGLADVMLAQRSAG